MNKVFKLGIMLTLSLSALTGCSADVTGLTTTNLQSSTGNGYTVAADSAATALTASAQPGGAPGKAGKGGKGGPGGHGGPGGKGGPQGGVMGIAFGADLNLTDDQKAQLKAIMEANKPQQPQVKPDTTKMDSLKTAFSDAFLADTFDAAALKAKLDAAKPVQNDDRITQEATILLQSYNVLTAEQKATLEAKQAEMEAKTPPARPTPSAEQVANMAKMEADRMTKLATDLGLDDTQKASLAAVMQPPAKVDNTDEQAKRKANHDALNAALKSGTATVESIVAILKANAPTDMGSGQDNEIDRLAKIHDILNADQRKKFIANNKGFGFGPGGKEGPGGHGGPQGGHEGGKGGHGGPQGGGPRPDGKGAPSQVPSASPAA